MHIVDKNIILMPTSIEKKANIEDGISEYEILQDIRRQLTDISSTLSNLSNSNNLETKTLAKELESKIDGIRREIFDFNSNEPIQEIPGFEGTMETLKNL
jgi:hypothetical protein